MFQEGNTVRDLDQGTGPIRLRMHDISPDGFASGHQRPEPKRTDRIWKSLSAEAGLGAGSVVLKNVPPGATVVGIPARVVGWSESAVPGLDMDQRLPLNSCI